MSRQESPCIGLVLLAIMAMALAGCVAQFGSGQVDLSVEAKKKKEITAGGTNVSVSSGELNLSP